MKTLECRNCKFVNIDVINGPQCFSEKRNQDIERSESEFDNRYAGDETLEMNYGCEFHEYSKQKDLEHPNVLQVDGNYVWYDWVNNKYEYEAPDTLQDITMEDFEHRYNDHSKRRYKNKVVSELMRKLYYRDSNEYTFFNTPYHINIEVYDELPNEFLITVKEYPEYREGHPNKIYDEEMFNSLKEILDIINNLADDTIRKNTEKNN